MTTAASRLSPPVRRYVIIGSSIYVFELLIIVLAQTMGSTPVFAVGLSFWLGLLMSFIVQKFVTFEDKRTQKQVVGRQIVLFSALVLWNFGFTLLLTQLLQHHLSPLVCRTLALGVTTSWNFYLYKTRIFNVNPLVT